MAEAGTPSPPSSPKLLPHQLSHVSRLRDMLRQFGFAMDTSIMGAGKMYTALWLACNGGYAKCMVVCPAAVVPKWKKVAAAFGASNRITVMSFDACRGLGSRAPKHGYLEKMSPGKFRASETFANMVAEGGVLLVCDEAQHLKNNSAQTAAFGALVSAVVQDRPRSGALLLSATPFDKPLHVVNLLRTVMLDGNDICEYDRRGIQGAWRETGAATLYAACEALDPRASLTIRRTHGRQSRAAIIRYVYDLFVRVLRTRTAAEMKAPHAPTSLIRLNGYYDLPAEEAQELETALGGLRSSIDARRVVQLTAELCAVETAKVPLLSRLVTAAIASAPNCKVIVAVNYTEPLWKLQTAITAANPAARIGVVNGRIVGEARDSVLGSFQLRNDVEGSMNVLLGNSAVIETGLDLDDKYGDEPRFLFMSPSHRGSTVHQLTGRVCRADTVGTAHAVLVYGLCALNEESVIRALKSKSCVLADTLVQQVKDGGIFPGQYATYAEASVVQPGPGPSIHELVNIAGVDMVSWKPSMYALVTRRRQTPPQSSSAPEAGAGSGAGGLEAGTVVAPSCPAKQWKILIGSGTGSHHHYRNGGSGSSSCNNNNTAGMSVLPLSVRGGGGGGGGHSGVKRRRIDTAAAAASSTSSTTFSETVQRHVESCRKSQKKQEKEQ